MPKAGRSFADCEDAYFPCNASNLEASDATHDQIEIFRAAVCDGATDSIFSKLWAQLLAQGYGAGKWATDISAQSIVQEQDAWKEFLSKQQLPWYAEEKAELGAFAALVGLTIVSQPKQWTAFAVGDCCIFQIRNCECVLAFPITTSAKFSNFPLLLNSIAERNADVFNHNQTVTDATWQSGDHFYLLSDTVACWFLSQIEAGNGGVVIPALANVQTLEAFTALVNDARTAIGADGNCLMKDDDVTMTIVRVNDFSTSPSIEKQTSKQMASGSSLEKQPTDSEIDAKIRKTADLPKFAVNPRPEASAPAFTPKPDAGPLLRATVDPPAATARPDVPIPVATAGGARTESPISTKRALAKSTRQSSPSSTKGIVVASVVAIGVLLAALGFKNFIPSHKTHTEPTPHVGIESTSVTTPSLIKNESQSMKQLIKRHKAKSNKSKKIHQIVATPERTLVTAPDQAATVPDQKPTKEPQRAPERMPEPPPTE